MASAQKNPTASKRARSPGTSITFGGGQAGETVQKRAGLGGNNGNDDDGGAAVVTRLQHQWPGHDPDGVRIRELANADEGLLLETDMDESTRVMDKVRRAKDLPWDYMFQGLFEFLPGHSMARRRQIAKINDPIYEERIMQDNCRYSDSSEPKDASSGRATFDARAADNDNHADAAGNVDYGDATYIAELEAERWALEIERTALDAKLALIGDKIARARSVAADKAAWKQGTASRTSGHRQ
jgi:hypothetical protein